MALVYQRTGAGTFFLCCPIEGDMSTERKTKRFCRTLRATGHFVRGKGVRTQNERTVHNTARKDKQERMHTRTQVEWEVQYTSNSCSCTPMVQRNLSSAVVAFCSALWLAVSRPRTSAIVGMALAYDKKLPHSLVQGSRWHKIGWLSLIVLWQRELHLRPTLCK